MSVTNVSNVDWNLFLVLHTVLEEGSATKAAKRLHVTQSAVSNALARLRVAFDDPLVVRIGNQLVPTPKGRALAPRIQLVVRELSEVLTTERAFDPTSSPKRFVLASSDDVELSLLGALTRAMQRELPNATVHVTSLGSAEAANGLASGEIDALVGIVDSVPPGCAAEELFEDELALVVPVARSPRKRDTLKLAEFAELPRIGVRSSLDVERTLERALEAREVRSTVRATVPTFVAGAIALRHSDGVMVIPRRAALLLAPLFELSTLHLEGKSEPFSVNLIWHARTDADPAAMAFREILRASATNDSA